MIRSFELSRHRRANIWLDHAPPADFTATSVVTCLVKPKMVLPTSRYIAAVELKIPRGPMASYCLLGAELLGADADGLSVVVSVNKVGFPLQSSIALMPDDVKVGLLDEYAGAVTNGVARIAESIGAPNRAILRFRWAAHALVGSSPSEFEKASAIVVQLLTLPADVSEKQVCALLEGS
jgi:hypothetical protein